MKLNRSVSDYLICGVAAIFICAYLSVGIQPTSRPEPVPDPTPMEQQGDPGEQEAASPEPESEGAKDGDGLGDLTVTFIDVGQGDSTLVELPDDKVMLVDAGEASASGEVLDALESADVDRIDYLVATHPHADHIGGMEDVLAAYEVGEVWMPDVAEDTATYEGFLDAVEAEGCPVEEATSGKQVVGDEEGYSVDVLAPAEGTDSDDMNRYSAIIRVAYEDTSLLVTGDADASQIVGADPGHVDVLKASHHGSETGTTDAVMDETTPGYVVMSYAEGNSYGHPDQSVLDAIAAAGATPYSTAANGDVRMTLDGEDVTVECEREGEIVAGDATEPQAEAQQGQEAAPEQGQQAEQQSKTVVITPTGSKFHNPGCRTLSRSKSLTELTRDEAVAQGYEPCGVCKP